MLAQLLGALHRFRRGSNPASLEFFRFSFRNCISSVFNCGDLLCIYGLVFLAILIGGRGGKRNDHNVDRNK